MREFIKLVENYGLSADDARLDREKKIEKLIRYAFARIDLPISDDFGIVYDEDHNREATVTLEDNVHGYSADLLNRLYSTGLADDYLVRPRNLELEIIFKVKKELDSADI